MLEAEKTLECLCPLRACVSTEKVEGTPWSVPMGAEGEQGLRDKGSPFLAFFWVQRALPLCNFLKET